MTRLVSEQVAGIGSDLDQYDQDLIRKTGLNLRRIAARAAGINEGPALEALSRCRVAVVPVTAGQGVISGFSAAVHGIVSHLGADSRVVPESDVAGLAGAVEEGAGVVFMADDRRFVVLNLATRLVVDNTWATARGYASALAAMTGGLKGQKVLVLGAGRVGRSAVPSLKELGAVVGVYDPVRQRAEALALESGAALEEDPDWALSVYRHIFCAAPAPGILRADQIKPDTFIAAPGIPACFGPEVYRLARDRLVHDPLQIGVATMLLAALNSRRPSDGRRQEYLLNK